MILFDGLRHLPHFNPDTEEPPAVRDWRKALAGSDAVLIASPEYGHSLPGALKNGIDWVIGSGECLPSSRRRGECKAGTSQAF